MSECQVGGCNSWVHVLGANLDIDYCCCIDADWHHIDNNTIVCATCELPIYRDVVSENSQEVTKSRLSVKK